MARSVHTDTYRAILGVLVEARRHKGLTQLELAARLHKPQSFVSKYENSERRLDIAEFLNVARAIGVDPCSIIKRSARPTKKAPR